ncbi:MAG: ATP-binding protein [Acidobacteriaceae bacterium]
MRIAIASGKGGTGKTTVSTNLALAAAQRRVQVTYVDCDVEAPNGHLFLKPQITASRTIGRLHPEVDEAMCTHCGLCGEFCQYSAIVCIGEKVLVYPDLCHACGGCTLVCPADAIMEVMHETGKVESGMAGEIAFLQGRLNIGEAMSTPLIRQLKEQAGHSDLLIFDCPPGASCPVLESVRGADVVLLVTEPTPFGLNDLGLAVEMLQALAVPLAVVINRAGSGDEETYAFCQREGIPIWAEIPDDRRVAQAYSHGEMARDSVPEFHAAMEQIMDHLSDFSQKEQLAERGVRRS